MTQEIGQIIPEQAFADRHFVSLNCTSQYRRFWKDSHDQTKLGLSAFSGLDLLKNESPEDWESAEVDHISKYIESSVFVKSLDNFQTFIVELVSSIFSQRPEMVPKSQIDTSMIFEIDDINELRSIVVENIATKYAFMNVVDLDEELGKRYSFRLFSSRMRSMRIRRLVEIRNVIVHNRGRISRMFIRKTGSKYDKLNAIIFPPSSIRTDHYLTEVAADIDHRAICKFNLKRVCDG